MSAPRVPAVLAVAAADVRGRADFRRPARRGAALEQAAALLGRSGAEGLARAQLREARMREALIRRDRITLVGAEHLRPGQILAGLHLGPMALLQQALARRLGPALHVSRFSATVADAPTARKVAALQAAGARIVPRGGSFAVLRDALAAGGSVWIAIDAPGSRPARLLHRQVRLGSGIPALAAATGAEVLPVHALRQGHRAVGVIGAPIAPDHDVLVAHADATLGAHLDQALPEVFFLFWN